MSTSSSNRPPAIQAPKSMHRDCYISVRGHDSMSPHKSRFGIKCEAGEECLHGGLIKVGAEVIFVRSRRSGEHAAATPASVALASAAMSQRLPSQAPDLNGAIDAMVEARVRQRLAELLGQAIPAIHGNSDKASNGSP